MKIIPLEKYKLLNTRNAAINRKEYSQSRLFYFKNNSTLQITSCLLIVFGIALSIETYNRELWLLENIITAAAAALLVYTYRWFRFSNKSYVLLSVLLFLHIIGAKYTYSLVPCDSILKLLCLQGRNNYDRLISILFGFNCMLPAIEISRLFFKVKGNRIFITASSIIISSFSLYKVFEMWLSMLISPRLAEMYLALQGDKMDTIWDIQMCFTGIILFVCYITLKYKINEYKILKKTF